MNTPRILDCTIRDGSYVVDFQFTAEDTAVIAAGLESAGIEWIEIGHGLGLNASNAGKGAAAATDDAYLRAAQETLRHAMWGMFFIPGIGRHEDLERAASYGMRFVRIGANAPEIDQTEPFVRRALELGLHVSVNLMKSYAVPPERLVELSKMAEGYGAHVVSLVDSAGTMLPDDVRAYVSRMKDALRADIGFHGHDNLALGMANVLAAIEAGAAVVDTTLQGIGRGGGNAVTEILVAILHKQGVATGIDLNRLMDVSERVVRPLLKGKGHDPLNITSGFAGFHSSALAMILRHADRHHVDPRDLIVEVSGVDRVEVTNALVEEAAARISKRHQGRSGVHVVDRPQSFADAGSTERSFAEAAAEAARKARAVAIKSGRTSVFNVVAAPAGRKRSSVSQFVQEDFESVIASAEVHDRAAAAALAAAVGAEVDVWLVDADVQPGAWSPASVLAPLVEQSRFLSYRDGDTWLRAVDLQIASLSPDTSVTAMVVGGDGQAARAAIALSDRGRRVIVVDPASSARDLQAMVRPGSQIEFASAAEVAARQAGVLVAFARGTVPPSVVDALPGDAIIFDAGIGALQPAAIARATERGIRVLRPDMRAALAAELSAAAGTRRVATELMGRGDIDGVSVVAGGLVGSAGDVVVDSITNPTRVLGIATGDGSVNYSPGPELLDRVTRVQRAIWRRKLGAEGN
jgi:4-hydroxy 2-oxovalerate aldolase/long-chain acyl-CoA synthetase